MNILVTGGNGFLGSHLIRELTRCGHKITCLIRPKSKLDLLAGLYPIHFTKNLNSFESYDFIYHVAGILGGNSLLYNDYRYVHYEFPKELMDKMRDDGVFIYISSAYVTDNLDNHSYYEKTKLMGEMVIRGSRKKSVIVRPGVIYGPHDFHLLPLFKYINKFGRLFPIIGSGNNKIDPIYVRDVAKAITPDRLDKQFYTLYNDNMITLIGHAITMKEFLRSIAGALGVGKPFIKIPPVYKTDFFCTQRLHQGVIGKTSLAYGLERTVAWYRKRGFL